jgi:hypothetical protein
VARNPDFAAGVRSDSNCFFNEDSTIDAGGPGSITFMRNKDVPAEGPSRTPQFSKAITFGQITDS